MGDIAAIKSTVNDLLLKYTSKAKRITQEDSSELSNAISVLLENIKEKKTIPKRIQAFKIVESIIDIVLNSSIQNIDKLIGIMLEIQFSDLSSTASSNKRLKKTSTKEQYELVVRNMFSKIFDFIKRSKVDVKEPILAKFHDKLKNIKNKDFHLFDFDKILIKVAEHYLNDTPKNRTQRQIITNIYKKTSQSRHLLSTFCRLDGYINLEQNIRLIMDTKNNMRNKVKDITVINERIHTGILSYIEEKIIENTKMNKHCLRDLLNTFEFMFLNHKQLFLDEFIIVILDVVHYLHQIHGEVKEEYLCTDILDTLRNIKNDNTENTNKIGVTLDNIQKFLEQLLRGLDFEGFVEYEECSMALFSFYTGKETEEHMEVLNRELFVYCDNLHDSIKNILLLFIKREDKINKDIKFRIFERTLDLK